MNQCPPAAGRWRSCSWDSQERRVKNQGQDGRSWWTRSHQVESTLSLHTPGSPGIEAEWWCGGLLLPLSSRYKGSRSPHWEAKKPAMEESNDSRGDINVTRPLSLSWYKELTQIHGIHSTFEGKGSQISNLHGEHLPSTPNRDQTDRK